MKIIVAHVFREDAVREIRLAIRSLEELRA
jgi:hypothetical protein